MANTPRTNAVVAVYAKEAGVGYPLETRRVRDFSCGDFYPGTYPFIEKQSGLAGTVTITWAKERAEGQQWGDAGTITWQYNE